MRETENWMDTLREVETQIESEEGGKAVGSKALYIIFNILKKAKD